MNNRTLGLDLGSNSIGWAILDDLTGDILDKGVVVFPEGVNMLNESRGKQETPAAARRMKRMARRMRFRRKLRKWKLLEVLIGGADSPKMCPLSTEELLAWRRDGVFPVSNKEFVNWLKSTDETNPYADRAAAATSKVDPYVLGRALYHIAQRRGFKSSRKDASEDEADEKKLGEVKGDIAALTNEIKQAGCRTLGQYFAKKIESEKGRLEKTRVRGRYTGREEHYMVEFATIMTAQGIAHGDKLYKRLYDAIFYQRPLRSQKHLVGKCPLEPKSPRAQIGHPAFEEFRALEFVNNLRFVDSNGKKLTLSPDEKRLAFGAFEKGSSTFKFSAVSKLFKEKLKRENLRFHYYGDKDVITGCPTRSRLREAFGAIEYDEQKVFDALMFFDDDEKLAEWFRRHYPALPEESIAKLCNFHLKEGNAQYSLKAINKILPFLRKGHDLFTAKLLAKLPDFIKDYSEKEELIVLHLQEMQVKCRRMQEEYVRRRFPGQDRPPRLLDMYENYFRDEFGFTEKMWNGLYLNDASPYSSAACDNKEVRLPPVKLGMLRNPLVQRSMTMMRTLVNYLRDHDKIDHDTTIRVELARGVNNFATRRAIQEWQKAREEDREAARKELGAGASEELVDRYILWKEQGEICMYTGRTISLSEVLGGNSVDVEHTVPRSRSGDDSLANKTLCDARYNREVKKGLLPTQCPNYEDEIYIRLGEWRDKVAKLESVCRSQTSAAKRQMAPERRTAARIKAVRARLELDYWRDKLKRFEITIDRLEDPEKGLSDFKRRQLVDTGIMSRHAVEFLRCRYPRVYAVNGAATAFARKAWGIQEDAAKDRSSHVHHAVDAMVIAALSPTRFNNICTALKDDGGRLRKRECDICPEPYEDFSEKVRKAASEILVRHVFRRDTTRQSFKRNALAKAHESAKEPGRTVRHVKSMGDTVRGELHKDTFYGCIINPQDGKKAFVVRKPLEGTIAEVEKTAKGIVDPAIREIVENAVAGFKADGVKRIERGAVKMPSGVPIKNVRIFANTSNPQQLCDHDVKSDKDYKVPYYVTSGKGSNFRLGLFCVDGKFSARADNALDWAQNHKRDDYEPMDRRPGFIGYIVPGSMALATEDGSIDSVRALDRAELAKRLYKVVKFEGTGRITFRLHNEARADVSLSQDLVKDGKHKAGESSIDFNTPHALLLLSPVTYFNKMLFEGIHFDMHLDGTISFCV